jgi:hypothetical protein
MIEQYMKQEDSLKVNKYMISVENRVDKTTTLDSVNFE